MEDSPGIVLSTQQMQFTKSALISNLDFLVPPTTTTDSYFGISSFVSRCDQLQQQYVSVIQQQDMSEHQDLGKAPSSPTADDGFGPEEEFGLGRSWGYSIRPPLTFKNIALKLIFARRVWLFWMIVNNSTYDATPIADQFLLLQAAMNKTLSPYDECSGRLLICYLESCSDRLFLKHLKILMIDTGLPKTLNRDDPDSEEYSNTPEYEEDCGQSFLCTDAEKSFSCKRAPFGRRMPYSSRRKGASGATSSDNDFTASSALVLKTRAAFPFEICDHLCKTYIHQTFGPRRRLFDLKSFNPLEQRLISKIFLAAYKTYQPSFVADTIWVFEGEDFWESLYAVFGAVANPGIKKAELVLSLRDVCFWCMARVHEDLTPIGQNPVLWGPELLEWDVLSILDRWRHHCSMVQRDIIGIWRDRFNMLARLALESFVLDMMDVYSLDQNYIGVQTARKFQRFTSGMPAKFTIYAPTVELEREIRGLILETNSAESSQTAANASGW